MPEEPTVNEMMEAYASDAVDHARASFSVNLNYTQESIEQVERILSQLHSGIPRGFWKLIRRGPSDDTIWTLSKMYGGYIGEVFRRARGGEWMLESGVVAEGPVISLRSGETRIFPPSKVAKRLYNGPEDDVWMYFRVLMSDAVSGNA